MFVRWCFESIREWTDLSMQYIHWACLYRNLHLVCFLWSKWRRKLFKFSLFRFILSLRVQSLAYKKNFLKPYFHKRHNPHWPQGWITLQFITQFMASSTNRSGKVNVSFSFIEKEQKLDSLQYVNIIKLNLMHLSIAAFPHLYFPNPWTLLQFQSQIKVVTSSDLVFFSKG